MYYMSLKSWLMKIKQYDIWLADLNPTRGTEPGKTRPVVILQTDLLNEAHPSTIICPITTNVQPDADLLRVHLRKGQLDRLSDILVDQVRAVDNRRLIKRLGKLTSEQIVKLRSNIKIVLDLWCTAYNNSICESWAGDSNVGYKLLINCIINWRSSKGNQK